MTTINTIATSISRIQWSVSPVMARVLPGRSVGDTGERDVHERFGVGGPIMLVGDGDHRMSAGGAPNPVVATGVDQQFRPAVGTGDLRHIGASGDVTHHAANNVEIAGFFRCGRHAGTLTVFVRSRYQGVPSACLPGADTTEPGKLVFAGPGRSGRLRGGSEIPERAL